MGRPDQSKALITGGNRGIGKAIAQGLLSDHEVILGVRDAAAGQSAAAELGCGFVTLDLMQPDTFAQALSEIGGVDVLVNNAGVLTQTSMIEDPEGFETSMQVMVHAPFHLIRMCLPHMEKQGWGRIVNLSSGWGSFAEGLQGPGAYGVAKAALNALSHALPRDLPAGVKINAMCPGWVRTRMGGASATRSVEEGAETALWLARLPDDGPTGGFFRDRQPIDW